ncbi:MAG TPA: response regulator [Candidatus Acidoferrum sp.]|nr:response regulator [Candidatus Acidoferrum sp.]
MAKILVADDNSNIQKMVTLALKDQGIDVVAVGNGEAAVRKISELRPDLVLADVFMPVRNGYEVCQYVKLDSALAHIPVILLVGAFDPLDEQEAQRVGADGVLKKPFVPPDPLISMVKSALTRAGVALGAAPAKSPEHVAVKPTEFPRPHVGAIPNLASIPAQAPHVEAPIAAVDGQSFVDEVPMRPEPVRIDSGSQPVAFGSLLETPVVEEEDPAFLPPVNSELALERDWRDKDDEESEEGEEEEKPAAAWRPDGVETFADGESPTAATDWRAGGFEQIKSRKSEYEAWESEQENPSVVETAKTTPEVNKVVEEPRKPVTRVPEVAQPIPFAPFSADKWAPPVDANSQQASVRETVTAVEEPRHPSTQEKITPPTTVKDIPEVKQQQPEQKPASSSWYSAASSPWDSEIQKANKLASAWDSAVPMPSTPAATNGTEKVSGESKETAKAATEQATLPAAAVEAIREEAAQVAEDATKVVTEPSSGETDFYARQEEMEVAAPAPEPSMDDLVAKVLAKMSPEVVQAVTREILKPVVEAMVKEELKSKKP